MINNNINMNNNNNFNQINGFHEHPLFISHQNDKICNICLQKISEINGNLSYRCNSCPIIICKRCIKDIFNGNINIGLHPHKLKLKYINQLWNCIKCDCIYGSDKCVSLYCEQCNLNFCDICYKPQQDDKQEQEQGQEQHINANNEENDDNSSHKHNLIYVNLNDICYFCNCRIENKLGYKCENNDLILCNNCYEIIYIYGYKENNSFHKHDLRPSIVKESDEEDDEVKKYVTDIVNIYKNINDCINQ